MSNPVKQFAKFVAVLVQNLPEMDKDLIQAWIDNPKALKKALEKVILSPSVAPFWKSINIGTNLKTASAFCQAFFKEGFDISFHANKILTSSDFTVSKEEKVVDLYRVSLKQLGFKEGATWSELLKRAEIFGLSLCSLEIAPQLCLQLEIEPHTLLTIAMEPLVIKGESHVFDIRKGAVGSDLELTTREVTNDWYFDTDTGWEFIFSFSEV